MNRVILIVLDGVGCGALPDAAEFGDVGADTLGNLSRHFEDGLRLPNLEKLGLGNIADLRGVMARDAHAEGLGCFGRCRERSAGKDSTTGHWEIAGLITSEPFPTYPEGFPAEVLEAFSRAIGRGVLGNRPASGTRIIEELGEEHLRSGAPIIYTSADSVFQIAAHDSVYSAEQLYEVCSIARRQLIGPHNVSRVIARPFTGSPGSFTRTDGRRDFSVAPPGTTLLDSCLAAEVATIGIGKIGDLFAHRGLSEEIHTAGNLEGVEAMIESMKGVPAPALIFTNLVEFDSKWGHRNDCEGYRRALEEFDSNLPAIFAAQRPTDLMIIASDHGVDPTTPGTDHTREYIPLLVWGAPARGGVDLGTRSSFADIGQTVAEYLGCETLAAGQSFLEQVLMHGEGAPGT